MPNATSAVPGRLVAWVRGRDPELRACRLAVRVTTAACLGFYLCRYVLGDGVMATFAVFGAIALGALSDVFGAPSVRTRVYLLAFPAAAGLVALGTALAWRTWTAVLGMLVVGFLVAYAGVGGPRLIGLVNGMQLFYILPCFPPYQPDTLPERLLGLAVGVGLLIVADRVLWPAPAPPAFCTRIADTADLVARYLTKVRLHPEVEQVELREHTLTALEELRLTSVPVPQRPTGPGHRDRGLTHAAGAIRIIGARTAVLDELMHSPDAPPAELTSALLGAVRTSLIEVAAALRGRGPAPVAKPLLTMIEKYLDARAGWIARRGDNTELPDGLRAGVAALAIAESTRGLVAAARAAVGARPDTTAEAPPTAWYTTASTARLWRGRLLLHLTPRSVYLQNAVRLALGLAVARAAVDLFDLSHGMWVLLATLTLMRTSLIASGSALVPAFTGTLVGAGLGAALLTVIGGHGGVYAVMLPVVMVLAFAAGPVLGPPYGQAGFTIVVATLFAQVSPATWELAGSRLLDVVAGGLIGAAIGAAVWPRGGAGEIRRIAEKALRTGADELVTTVDAVGGVCRLPPSPLRLKHLAVLFEDTFSQYRSEPARPNDVDWLTVLSVVGRLANDSEVLTSRHPELDPLPWPGVADRIDGAARDVATGYRKVAEALAARRTSDCGSMALMARLRSHPLSAQFAAEPRAALRALDAWGWLQALSYDLDRVERALNPGSNLDVDRTTRALRLAGAQEKS
ncbi:MAG TPA: FUSC family protein [Pseudonocardia sp.]|nr:FUSC family protein [Pseudonocardia sp.]